jgi:hypothetical protein
MMQAFNDEETGKSIQNWIDMIFGYKQKGKFAVESKNLFHPLCYPRAQSTVDAADEDEKEAISTCIVNFGQCPIQLFKKPHPMRNSIQNANHILSNLSTELLVQHLNKGSFIFPVTDVYVENNKIFTTNGTSVILPFDPTNIIVVYPPKLGILICHQDNTKHYTKLLRDSKSLLQSQSLFAPSCYTISNDGLFFGVGHFESSTTIFQIVFGKDGIKSSVEAFNFPTLSTVRSICISSAHFIVACSCGSFLERYCIGTRRVLNPTNVGFTISHLAVDDHLAVFICCGTEIAIVSVSGEVVCKRNVESRITCIQTTILSPDIKNRFFITGSFAGDLIFWSINNEKNEISCIKKVNISKQPIIKVAIDSTCQRIVCCTSEDIYEVSYFESSLKPLKKEYANECCDCKSSDSQKLRICYNCHRYVCEDCAIELQSDQTAVKKIYCTNCYSKF